MPTLSALRLADGALVWRHRAPEPAKCSFEGRCGNGYSGPPSLANGVLYGSANTYDRRTGGSDSYCSDCSDHLIRIGFDLTRRRVQARDLGRFGPQFQNLEDALYGAPFHRRVGTVVVRRVSLGA